MQELQLCLSSVCVCACANSQTDTDWLWITNSVLFIFFGHSGNNGNQIYSSGLIPAQISDRRNELCYNWR